MGRASTPEQRQHREVPGRPQSRVAQALDASINGPRGAEPEALVAALIERCAVLQERVDQLQTALNSRVIIEQAKGVLAERHGLAVDSAFEVLRAHARRNNLRVHDLARAVVDGHGLATHRLSAAG